MFHLGKTPHEQYIFKNFYNQGSLKPLIFYAGGPSSLNNHISLTPYARNCILTPNCAEYVVSYSTVIHFMALANLFHVR